MEEVKKQGIESLFVPYEIALALKELGFDEPCFSYIKHLGYDNSKEKVRILSEVNRSQIEDLGLSLLKIPTFSQAFRWFREKYGYCHFINHSGEGYCSGWEDLGNNEHGFENYTTYEEAELECLKKLIEIVKK